MEKHQNVTLAPRPHTLCVDFLWNCWWAESAIYFWRLHSLVEWAKRLSCYRTWWVYSHPFHISPRITWSLLQHFRQPRSLGSRPLTPNLLIGQTVRISHLQTTLSSCQLNRVIFSNKKAWSLVRSWKACRSIYLIVPGSTQLNVSCHLFPVHRPRLMLGLKHFHRLSDDCA